MLEVPFATGMQKGIAPVWIGARTQQFIGNPKMPGVACRHHQRCCPVPNCIHVLLAGQSAHFFRFESFRQARCGGEPKAGQTRRMRSSRSKPAKQFRGRFQTAEDGKFVGRHVQRRGTNGRVGASLKQEANSLHMAGMPRSGEAKFQRAAQRSLTPDCGSYPIWVRPSRKKTRHFRRVARPAGLVEQLPLHKARISWIVRFICLCYPLARTSNRSMILSFDEAKGT